MEMDNIQETQMEQAVEQELSDLKDELFPGGPTYEQIEAWKEQYGDVYMTEYDDNEVYIWRTLTRAEYKQVMAMTNLSPAAREEKICHIAVLYPSNFNELAQARGKAGVPTVLAEQIMEKSGFLPTEEARKL